MSIISICGRGGHNTKFQGASDIVNEVEENRKIISELNSLLIQDEDFNYTDVTPDTSTSVAKDLKYSINIANSMKVDLYFSIHINASGEKEYLGPIGSECWIYPNNESKISGLVGREVLKELGSLGFINRGIKVSSDFAELSNTYMPAVIIECFFCNSKGDTDLYSNVGYKAIAYAIYLGIKAATRSESPTLPMNGSNINQIKDCHNCKNCLEK
ncbi:MAG: N-acetylmuramoyl-L-alanine amidase [Clostridium sp.]|uniref:N-acetylmuramoyl-L-alanine amidase n=1 Tax=Clostridium sp. TaxID=1506 RepID=UPI0032177491